MHVVHVAPSHVALQIPKRRPIPKGKLVGRFDKFASGQWQELIIESNKFAEEAATVMRRRHRRDAQNQTERSFRWASCLQGGRHWKVPSWQLGMRTLSQS